MIKTKDKFEICRKYRVYLEIIFILGNGVMLQKQFYEICRILNISTSDYQTRKVLMELQTMEIIKKRNFLYSKNKVIVLKKFAIRFLLNKESSSDVASIPKSIDKRVITSVFKVDRAINIIKSYDIYSWDNFLDKMYELNSTLIYNKNKGIFYHEMLINKYNLNLYEQELYIRGIENYNKMLMNLKRRNINNTEAADLSCKIDTDYINVLNKRNKTKNVDNITIDTLINSNIHIQSITKFIDTKIVEIIVMDINNSQNVNTIIDNIDGINKYIKDISYKVTDGSHNPPIKVGETEY